VASENNPMPPFRKSWNISRFTVCCALAFCASLTVNAVGQEPSTPGGLGLETGERRIGPLNVRGKRFAGDLLLKRVRKAGAPPWEAEETVAQVKIGDATGAVAYSKLFPYSVEGDHFVETVEVSAQVLEGRQGRGLLVTYSVEPSTPLGGQSWQVFGIRNGRLIAFGNPIAAEGSLLNAEPAQPESIVKTSAERGLDADLLDFRLWTGNFFVVLPVRVDWAAGRVGLARTCSSVKMTSRGRQGVCRLQPEVGERVRPAEGSTSVQLLAEDFEPAGKAQSVVVKESSKVEFLEAAGIPRWDETEQTIQLGVWPEDLWLKVRIDGREGWVHTQEEFTAVGAPQAD